MKVITHTGFVDDYATLVTVTDGTLDWISKNQKWYRDERFTTKAIAENGDNVVILSLKGDIGVKTILKKMKWLFEDYKTVSWWSETKNKFFTIKRR